MENKLLLYRSKLQHMHDKRSMNTKTGTGNKSKNTVYSRNGTA